MTPTKLRELLAEMDERAAAERVRALQYVHEDSRTRRRRERPR